MKELLLNLLGFLVPAYIGFKFGTSRDKGQTLFNKKLEIYSEITFKVNQHEYISYDNRQELTKLFAPARLLASKKTVEELRSYCSLVSEYYDSKNLEREQTTKKISISAMEIEQLMREELGQKRMYTKKRTCKP